jgi:hypothetical protein
MWNRLESTDIDKARDSLADRLAETMRRQDEEWTSLRAKHAEEIRLLEVKQTEIDTLNALIERFANEFQSITLTEPEAALEEEDASASVPTETAEGTNDENNQSTEEATETEPATLTLPERTAVRYASPNFGMVRKVAS